MCVRLCGCVAVRGCGRGWVRVCVGVQCKRVFCLGESPCKEYQAKNQSTCFKKKVKSTPNFSELFKNALIINIETLLKRFAPKFRFQKVLKTRCLIGVCCVCGVCVCVCVCQGVCVCGCCRDRFPPFSWCRKPLRTSQLQLQFIRKRHRHLCRLFPTIQKAIGSPHFQRIEK